MYIIPDLRSDTFKEIKWGVNHGVLGCRVSYIFLRTCLSSKWESLEYNKTADE